MVRIGCIRGAYRIFGSFPKLWGERDNIRITEEKMETTLGL